MNGDYKDTMEYWNNIFGEAAGFDPFQEIKIMELETGIEWLCDDVKSVLDFGCGNGKVLFRCLPRGLTYGLDISEKAIELANMG